MQLTMLSLIYFVAFSHALLIALALWRQTEVGQSGRILAVLMAVFGYKLLEGGVTYSNLYQQIPFILDWLPGAVLFIGPIFYGYIRVIVGEPALTAKQWALHLSPALLLFVLKTPDLFIPAQQKVAQYQSFLSYEGTMLLPFKWIAFLVMLKLHLATYLGSAWQHLRQFSQQVSMLRADNSEQVIKGQQWLCLALILLEALWVVLFLLQQTTSFVALNHVSQMWLLFMAVIILTMGYLGLKQPQLFLSQQERELLFVSNESIKKQSEVSAASTQTLPVDELCVNDNVISITSGQKLDEQPLNGGDEKYQQSSLPESTAIMVADLIEQTLREQSLFLDDKLSLTSLAKHLELKPHLVSQVINQHMATTFYKLVNQFRIAHAVILLTQDNNFSLERIAYESGFGNRVSFNNAFKQLKGCTPSAYRKQLTAG